MKTAEEIVHALKNPLKAPFKVTFEVFVSSDRKEIADLEKKIEKLNARPIESFMTNNKPFDRQEAQNKKDSRINSIKNNAVDPTRLLERLDVHTKRYAAVKEYFQTKFKTIPLENPLVFFDDDALRIDIGYGPLPLS